MNNLCSKQFQSPINKYQSMATIVHQSERSFDSTNSHGLIKMGKKRLYSTGLGQSPNQVPHSDA